MVCAGRLAAALALTLALALALVAGPMHVQAGALPRVALEPRQRMGPTTDGWRQLRTALRPSTPLDLTFVLAVANGEQLEELFWAVSEPSSAQYGEHLSKDEVDALLRPAAAAHTAVREWLVQHGIAGCEDVVGRFLRCAMTVGQAEALLETRFAAFAHPKLDVPVYRASTPYTVPADMAAHISFVGNVHRFPLVEAKAPVERPQGDPIPIHIGIDPAILRWRYNISKDDVGSVAGNSQAVAQFLNQHFHEPDLVEFFIEFGNTFEHRRKLDRYVGPDSGLTGVEAALDTEYIMSLGANITTWFWSTGGERKQQEPFLEWIMDVANHSDSPPVHSVSYGDDEDSLDVTFMTRVNAEFKALGLRGISIMFASGDSGASCNSSNVFVPSFPAGSPYVTAVGGTLFVRDGRSEDGNYISGGGFSNVFAQPAYQTAGVAHFLNTSKRLPSPSMYNAKGRAYPDVAACSSGFWVVANLIPTPGVAGTSCAAPTFSGVISLLNEQRIKAGKATLGFLNPLLYANPGALFDVVEGCNAGCSDTGFCSQAGWDPVTGLGTPNYPALVKIL